MARQFVLRTNTLKRLDLYVEYPNNICISGYTVVFLQKRIKTKGWIKIKQRSSVLNVVALMAVVYPFSIKKAVHPPWSQWLPVYPSEQVHLYSLAIFLHNPPFRQGFSTQWLMSAQNRRLKWCLSWKLMSIQNTRLQKSVFIRFYRCVLMCCHGCVLLLSWIRKTIKLKLSIIN